MASLVSRKLVLAAAALAALLALPAAAAARPLLAAAVDESPLALRNGDGFVVVAGRAALLGSVERGLLIVTAPRDECVDVTVHGEEWRSETTFRRMYGGRDLRFRIVSEGCRVALAGRDLHVSAVVRGFAAVKGSSGSYARDGGSWRDLPSGWQTHRLGTPRPSVDRPTRRSLVRLEIRWMREAGMSWQQIKRTAAWRRFEALG